MRRCWTIAAALIVFAGIVPAGRGADDADLNKKAVEAVKQFTRSAKAKDADGMMKVAGTPWSHSAEWDGDKTFHKPAELRKYFQNSIDDIRKSATRIPAEVFGGGDFSDLLDALKESKAGDDTVRLLRAVEVLGHIDSASARAVLRRLADGADDTRLTRQAKAALARLPS